MTKLLDDISNSLSQVIKGKQDQIHLVTCALISKGHVLIEDQPGLGKTTLAKAFARLLGKDLKRIQCTNDLLPADILGHSILNPKSLELEFKKGPVFSDFLLLDEINRAPSKTQSALLQVMEESQVSIDNQDFNLSSNQNVIATQNPLENVGTFSLPESQLDRFMIRISMGYSNEEETIQLLKNSDSTKNLELVKPLLTEDKINEIRKKVELVTVSDEIYKYVYRLVDYGRHTKDLPVSNRVALDLISMAKTYAYLNGSEFVLPDHIQSIFVPTCSHRLHLKQSIEHEVSEALDILKNTRSIA